MDRCGEVVKVSGPVVFARGVPDVHMGDQVEVGPEGLIGEVIGISGEVVTVQVYEETTGLKPGMSVVSSGMPLSVELGPGLIGSVYDGLQRPLEVIAEAAGAFIARGVRARPLDPGKVWHFSPSAEEGKEVSGGEVLGEVEETEAIVHRVLVPPGVSGRLVWVAEEGEYRVDDVVARVEAGGGIVELKLYHRWPVRRPRPVSERLPPSQPLFTGQRVLDFLFPVAKGGTAAVPGGFGSGKTVLQHQLAKWSDADVIVYIGCGERGNEMAQVLKEFPELKDPRTGRSLMERTVLIANTSNMPVTAREASIYTGITIAEYYRDMGYDVAVMADSTSRWAEALREISGRLEEVPAEEGYPAYLPSRLAEFYERAGRAKVLCGKEGSVSVIGAVSPPGGDFSEPVTQHTQRFVRAFWGLDKELASARHFPSVNWNFSYSDYVEEVKGWWEERYGANWRELREGILRVLKEEASLQHIVQLVGPDALPDRQRWYLEVAELIREAFLQQNAFDPVDSYCLPEKQLKMAEAILLLFRKGLEILERGVPVLQLRESPLMEEVARMKELPQDEIDRIDSLMRRMEEELEEMGRR